MGVHGLWELLAPVGRRVSVEALGNKKLAIDASIWIIQFMKAMRDERGDMIRNAHLLGFFRRICKLLFLRIKPVFVFDGGTPALKRRTVIARRRQRERAQSRIRKTAEKLLLNHLRIRKLEEIANNIGLSTQSTQNNVPSVEEEFISVQMGNSSTASAQTATDIANLSPVPKLDIENQQETQKKVFLIAQMGNSSTINAQAGYDISNESLDLPTEAPSVHSDSDEDEFFIPPSIEGPFDPEVLASLPPSMQLDLLIQMREQQVAHNRQKFQNVAKEPASFSQLQIQAYLKTVAFRREMNEVQRYVASGGVGMPSARIASETDREFIFSSSFHGEKQALFHGEEQAVKSSKETASRSHGEKQALFHGEEQAVKISKETASHSQGVEGRQGIRMTRDLEWNLYLMKEKDAHANKQTQVMKEPIDQTPSLVLSPGMAGQTNFHVDRVNDTNKQTGYEISFCDNDRNVLDEEDGYLFEALVKGEPVPDSTCFEALDRDKQRTCTSADEDRVEGAYIWEDRGDKKACISTGEGEEDECIWEDINVKHDAETVDNHVSSVEGQCSEKSVSYQGFQSETVGSGAKCPVNWEDGIETGSSMRPSEDINSYWKDIETSEYEEAIRRSLEDFGHGLLLKGCSKLKIQEAVPKDLMRMEDLTVSTADIKPSDTFSLMESQARKGKAVLEDDVTGNTFLVRKTMGLGDVEYGAGISTVKAIVSNMDSNTCSSDVSVGKKVAKQDSCVNSELHALVSNMDSTPCSHEFSVSNIEEKQDTGVNPEQHATINQMALFSDLGSLNKNTDGEPERLRKTGPLCTFIQLKNHSPPENSIVFGREDLYGEGRHVKTQTVEIAKSQSPQFQNKLNEIPEDVLIEDAQYFDFSENTKNFSERETAVNTERQELERQSEVLQANVQADQEDLQARLEEDKEMLLQEEAQLLDAQRRNERNAECVTGEMFNECQELLQMFGLPFIIAPMEAEAQCAYMDATHLVDGVVTDDSDVFLFGGQNVFKNIFDDRKYVETYYMKDLETELGLDQEKLIHMALLLGSDYTEGISGIGIVNAIEVVNAFPGENGLKKFKEWLDSPDVSLLKSLHPKPSRKSSKASKQKASEDTGKARIERDFEGLGTERLEVDDIEDDECMFPEQDLEQHFKEKHRAVSKNWTVPDSFPNTAVISAYKLPQVDKSTEPFSWGRPDLEALRRLCIGKFGWNKGKADELLLPVLKEYDRHEVQLRLEAFYSFNQQFAKIRSKRIQKAVTQITGGKSARSLNLRPDRSTSSPKIPSRKKENKQKSERKTTADMSKAEPLSRKQENKGPKRSIGKSGGRSKVKGPGKHQMKQVASGGSSGSSDSREQKDEWEREGMKGQIFTESQLPRRSSRPHQKANYNLTESDNDENVSDSSRMPEKSLAYGQRCHTSSHQASAMAFEVATEHARNNKLSTSADAKTVSPKWEGENGGTTVVERDLSMLGQIPAPGKSSSDYLAMGGGFCFSENQDEELLDVSASAARKQIMQDDASNILDEGLNSPENLPSANLATSNSIIFSINHQSLRVVPSLKRKRRGST